MLQAFAVSIDMCTGRRADRGAAVSSVFTAQGNPWGPWWVCRSQGPDPASVDQNLQGGPRSLNFNKVLSGPCRDCSVAPNTGQVPCSELPAFLLGVLRGTRLVSQRAGTEKASRTGLPALVSSRTSGQCPG